MDERNEQMNGQMNFQDGVQQPSSPASVNHENINQDGNTSQESGGYRYTASQLNEAYRREPITPQPAYHQAENQYTHQAESQNTAYANSNYQNQGYANPNQSTYGNPYPGYQAGTQGSANPQQKPKQKWNKKIIFGSAGVVAGVALLAGGIWFGYQRISKLTDAIPALQEEMMSKSSTKNSSDEKLVSEAGKSTTDQIGTTKVVDGEALKASDVSEVVENVMPSIVAINCTVSQSTYFLGQYYGEQEGQSSGSGVIIDEKDNELMIVTNNHVIEDASKITVTFSDNEEVEATVKGADADADLAVLIVKKKNLKSETLSKIKAIAIGNSDDMKVGQMTIAIGNALGYGQSVTVGYVSAKDRTITVDGRQSKNLLQTDAAINPGNSGGALINEKGELIGINSVKYSSTSVEGIGYAIAITDAYSMIHELENAKQLEDADKGYLGITCAEISETQNKQYNMPIGVYVAEVAKNGAAEEAGLMVGDIITKINGNEVQTTKTLQNRIQNQGIGTTVSLTIQRMENGSYQEHELEVVLKGKESLNELKNQEQQTPDQQQSPDQKQQEDSQSQESPEQNPSDQDIWNDFPFDEFFGW